MHFQMVKYWCSGIWDILKHMTLNYISWQIVNQWTWPEAKTNWLHVEPSTMVKKPKEYHLQYLGQRICSGFPCWFSDKDPIYAWMWLPCPQWVRLESGCIVYLISKLKSASGTANGNGDRVEERIDDWGALAMIISIMMTSSWIYRTIYVS
jgi:hypothetical protein